MQACLRLRVEGRAPPWRDAAEEAEECRSSARWSGGAQLGTLHASKAMQPPGAGWEDGLATGQIVRAGGTIPVDEGFVALQGLDPRRRVLACDARREPTAWLPCAWMRVPALAAHTSAAEKLDALLSTFSGGLFLGFGDSFAQELTVLAVAQMLEARCAAQMQLDGIR